MARKTAAAAYDVHPAVKMITDWIDGLKAKTGRSLEEWIKVIKKDGPDGEKECREWLKKEHGFGTNQAWWLEERARKPGAWTDGDPEHYLRAAAEYVEGLYSGPKEGLRPLHDALMVLARSLGKDVRISPCKTMVPVFREHVIAQIKPSTRTRIDFGLALGDTKGKGRLKETGGYAKKDRITHAIAVSDLDDIDDELKKWLKTAYDRDAPRVDKKGAKKTAKKKPVKFR